MYGFNCYGPPFPLFNHNSASHSHFRLAYPAVDTKIFTKSVKAFSTLMHQGNALIRHLRNPSFAYRLMDAAQHGRKTQVEQLVKSMGLSVPVTTRFSPTGIVFTLHSRETMDPFENCCSLSFAIKWGH